MSKQHGEWTKFRCWDGEENKKGLEMLPILYRQHEVR